MADTKTIDVKLLYGETAKLDNLSTYVEKAKALAGEGNEVVVTGPGPIWLYLKIAHALHGKAKKLVYRAPAMKRGEAQIDVVIFDHDPF
jgi:hypothetical protein